MGIAFEYLTYNGKSSRDFNVCISGTGIYETPSREVESISIPGRNGDLHIEADKYSNVNITYPAYITKDFSSNYSAFKAYLLSQKGYKRLMDSYEPDYYRLAAYSNSLSPIMTPLNRGGKFDIVFDCDPRRFLVSGDKTKAFTSNGSLKNPTRFDSLPLIRAYGTGSFIVSGITVQITSANTYTDIDCELQEAYKGSTNCNGNITLTDGVFPSLAPGLNSISMSGITRLEIKSRWWTI